MDQKQFDTFAEAVQWVKDERDHPIESEGHVSHRQSSWGWGRVLAMVKPVKAKNSVQPWTPVCPTSCCLAGNIVLSAGDQFVIPAVYGEVAQTNVDYCLSPEGEIENISTRARDLAGLTEGEASSLFEGSNSADYIIDLASRICEHNGYELNLL